jgi:hypothetical protein
VEDVLIGTALCADGRNMKYEPRKKIARGTIENKVEKTRVK